MTATPLVNRKLEEYRRHILEALDFYFKEDWEHCLQYFRKSGEALLKIFILAKYGENDGQQIILGNQNYRSQLKQSKQLLRRMMKIS